MQPNHRLKIVGVAHQVVEVIIVLVSLIRYYSDYDRQIEQ